jgi:hypothetical protein
MPSVQTNDPTIGDGDGRLHTDNLRAFVSAPGAVPHHRTRTNPLTSRWLRHYKTETVHNLGGLMRHGETGDGPIAQRSCDPC